MVLDPSPPPLMERVWSFSADCVMWFSWFVHTFICDTHTVICVTRPSPLTLSTPTCDWHSPLQCVTWQECHMWYQWYVHTRPTQSIMYVPLQVNRFQNFILLIVQYKYLKSCSSPNLILCTRLFGTKFITHPSCVVDFHLTEICQAEMICIGGVPVLNRHFGGAGP